MINAEIITIGTEILLGEIIDTNSKTIARKLRENGINIYRTATIGDNRNRISREIQAARTRANVILTTGGLGPTVDDPTRDAVADAFGVATEFHPELWEQVVARFARFDKVPTQNNRQQAFIPAGARAIENPVGTAPAFLMESETDVVICLPGVPREMEFLLEHEVLPYLQKRFDLRATLKVRILRTAGVGESQIDEKIRDLEALSNPTVGLSAHSGQVDVRITARAANMNAAEEIIAPVETQIRQRLGSWIFGTDEDTLASVAMRSLQGLGWNLTGLEMGLGGELLSQLAPFHPQFHSGQLLPAPPVEPQDLANLTAELRSSSGTQVGLGVALCPDGDRSLIYLALDTPDDHKFRRVAYGGPPQLGPSRAANLGLNLLRKLKVATGPA